MLLNGARVNFTDCFFFDNISKDVTNGISATESNVVINNTKIDNCLRRDCSKDKKVNSSRRLSAYDHMSRDLQSSSTADENDKNNQGSNVLAGFFYMSANS